MQDLINTYCQQKETYLEIEKRLETLKQAAEKQKKAFERSEQSLLTELREAQCRSIATCWKGETFVLIERGNWIEVHPLSYSDYVKSPSKEGLDTEAGTDPYDDMPF